MSFEHEQWSSSRADLAALERIISSINELHPKPGKQLVSVLQYLERLRQIYAAKEQQDRARLLAQ